jgi:transposase, IS5 family
VLPRHREPTGSRSARTFSLKAAIKAHIGVDSRTKLVHTVLASAANVADCLALQYLLHGKERRVWGDQAYRGQKAAIRAGAPRAKDFTNQRYRWGKRIDESVKATNRRKSSVRAKVEHVFGVIKRVFGFQKVCYRGLAKNLHRLEVTAALANLFLSRRRLLNA